MELVIRRPWHLTLLPMHWHILFCKTAWRHWDCAVNCMRVSDCPLNSLTSDQNCFGVGSWRFEDGVLDFKCSVLSCSHVKCSSEVVNPSVWFFGLSGIWRAWDCFLAWCSGRIGNVLACAGWNLTPTPAICSRTTSSQATIYRHCSSHSTVTLAYPNLTLCPTGYSGWRCRWLCHPVPMLAVSPGSELPPCCSLLQSASLRARASCTLSSSLPVLTLFSPLPISDPTQLSLCPYRQLLLTPVLNLALNFSFWTHPSS